MNICADFRLLCSVCLYSYQPVIRYIERLNRDKGTERQREMILGSLYELRKSEIAQVQARASASQYEELRAICKARYPTWPDGQIEWHVKGYMSGHIKQL